MHPSTLSPSSTSHQSLPILSLTYGERTVLDIKPDTYTDLLNLTQEVFKLPSTTNIIYHIHLPGRSFPRPDVEIRPKAYDNKSVSESIDHLIVKVSRNDASVKIHAAEYTAHYDTVLARVSVNSRSLPDTVDDEDEKVTKEIDGYSQNTSNSTILDERNPSAAEFERIRSSETSPHRFIKASKSIDSPYRNQKTPRLSTERRRYSAQIGSASRLKLPQIKSEPERRFLLSVVHASTGQVHKCKTRNSHDVRKVLSGVCRAIGVDPDSARLFLLTDIEQEDGQVVAERTECHKGQSIGQAGIDEDSRLLIVEDDDYEDMDITAPAQDGWD